MAPPRAPAGSLAALGPFGDAFALTAHATNPQPANNGVICTTAGNAVIRAKNSTADVTIPMLAGVYYPIQVAYFRATSTAALVAVA